LQNWAPYLKYSPKTVALRKMNKIRAPGVSEASGDIAQDECRTDKLAYREDVKENDHATDALRYSLPLEQEEKPFLYVVRR
jgi:hypothetical protein